MDAKSNVSLCPEVVKAVYVAVPVAAALDKLTTPLVVFIEIV
jgi:hypothetical protein